jgi:tetratricopeptide (TPR) repeat protein
MSLALAKGAVSLAVSGQATPAAQIAAEAQAYSEQTIKLNPNNPNFYKTQARVYAYLAAVDNRYIALSQKAIEDALKLSPTDAKLYFNLGLLYDQTGQTDQAKALYQKTIGLKPNYEAARQAYGLLLEASGNSETAIEQYQYILDRINPQNKLAPEHIASLSATLN